MPLWENVQLEGRVSWHLSINLIGEPPRGLDIAGKHDRFAVTGFTVVYGLCGIRLSGTQKRASRFADPRNQAAVLTGFRLVDLRETCYEW